MTELMDGLSNIYSLTAKINQLKESGQNVTSQSQASTQADINNSLLEIEKSFSQLLDNLISSSDEDKDKKDAYDPFSAIETYTQTLTAASTTPTTSTTQSTLDNTI